MRYMLLLYTNENERNKVSPEVQESAKQTHWAVIDETTRLGIFQGAEPLAPTNTATTVRRQRGKTLITDGPFAETKEQLAGYYILDCKDLSEAIAWAEKIPVCSSPTGCIEIRRLPGLPSRDEALVTNQVYSSVRG